MAPKEKKTKAQISAAAAAGSRSKKKVNCTYLLAIFQTEVVQRQSQGKS